MRQEFLARDKDEEKTIFGERRDFRERGEIFGREEKTIFGERRDFWDED